MRVGEKEEESNKVKRVEEEKGKSNKSTIVNQPSSMEAVEVATEAPSSITMES